ncbi:spore germination protein GerPE [Virgibacillus sp. SK37]|uniref:spore germination protein GerPE n=1 Tax=Virgibacillus sp. SK37 TaxID=403957 RepID=UPI0004D11A9A|nr:spore germination protein GerPE [Virgibacillus sp. SK37]AIF42738.1 spore germination protein [Virgibacillus sp. SK37]
MKNRTSIIDIMNINSISNSSIFNIGDTQQTNQKFRGIAIQKESANLTPQKEEKFTDYPIFQREAKFMENEVSVNQNSSQHNPTIRVQHISVIGVSSSSIIQAGSIKNIQAESRIKHFRKLKG